MVFENWEEKIKKAEFWVPALGGAILTGVGTAPKRVVRMNQKTKKYTALAGLAVLFGVGALLAFDPPVGPRVSRATPIPLAATRTPIPIAVGTQGYPSAAPTYYG